MRRGAALLAVALLSGAAADEPAASPIRFNQVGFEPAGAKRFIIESAGPVRWALDDPAGKTVAKGTAPSHADPESGERVATVTIDQSLAPGHYRLIANRVVSRPITITPRPFAQLFRDAMGFFYQQRADTPILARHVQRPDLARPAGHPHEIASCFTGTDTLGVVWPGCDVRVGVPGGWYDAGDRGKYVVNAGISVWTLLNAYERAQDAAVMRDGALALPEAGNGVPDLLDEARWEIEWMLRMQIADGTRVAVLGSDGKTTRLIDGGGLAWHKVADTHWAGLPLRVEDDHATRALYPPSTAATLNLAAVTAQAARVWRAIDPAFAKRCLDASRTAYAAAKGHPDLFADTRFTGSGGYEDQRIVDERFWAAAELAVTTGERDYIADLSSPQAIGAIGAIGWAETATLGSLSMLTVPNALPASLIATQRRAVIAAADRFLADDARQAYRIPTASGPTIWGSNADLLNRAIVLGTAHDLTHAARYRAAVVDAADYVLGRNPLDRSYVTGYGARPTRNPHHRFWAHGIDPAFPAPPPGVLSGGPNSAAMTDSVAVAMKGRCRPLTCWSDDARAYTQNEVAINWNAPFVWVAAFLDTTGRMTWTQPSTAAR